MSPKSSYKEKKGSFNEIILASEIAKWRTRKSKQRNLSDLRLLKQHGDCSEVPFQLFLDRLLK
jgi:hypothetical protein